MLYQILPRYDHQFQADTMRMFLKTLSGTKRRRSLRDRLSKLFDPNCILDYRFIIDCDGKDQTVLIALVIIRSTCTVTAEPNNIRK